jgi:hypothetical protein
MTRLVTLQEQCSLSVVISYQHIVQKIAKFNPLWLIKP